MKNFYNYKRVLKRTTFDNFISDDSNCSAYKTFVDLASRWNKGNNRILLTGPKRSGKTHLIVSLLDEILKSYPKVEIEKTNGADFLGHVIWEYQSGGHDYLDNYINSLLKKDILVIEEINYIDGQLNGHALTKSALVTLLDKWSSTNKLLIFTIDESSEHQIIDKGIIEKLKDFHNVAIGQQRSELIDAWLEKAVSISQVPIAQEIRENIISGSDSISRARYELLNHYTEKYKAFFDMERIELSVDEVLDYTLGEHIGYRRILDFSKLQTSEYTRKRTVYFLSKFAYLDVESISKTLKINKSQTEKDLMEVKNSIDNNEFTRDLWQCSEQLLLGLYAEE